MQTRYLKFMGQTGNLNNQQFFVHAVALPQTVKSEVKKRKTE